MQNNCDSMSLHLLPNAKSTLKKIAKDLNFAKSGHVAGWGLFHKLFCWTFQPNYFHVGLGHLISVTRLGDFLKFWVKYFVSKVAQMCSHFWAILKNVPFEIKTDLATFWATFEKNWATFTF